MDYVEQLSSYLRELHTPIFGEPAYIVTHDGKPSPGAMPVIAGEDVFHGGKLFYSIAPHILNHSMAEWQRFNMETDEGFPLLNLAITAVCEALIINQVQTFKVHHTDHREDILIEKLPLSADEIWNKAQGLVQMETVERLRDVMEQDFFETRMRDASLSIDRDIYQITRFVECRAITLVSVWCGSQENSLEFLKRIKNLLLQKAQ